LHKALNSLEELSDEHSGQAPDKPIREFRSGQIGDCRADGLEQGDLIEAGSSGHTIRCQVSKIAGQLVRCETAAFDRADDLAGFGKNPFAPIRENRAALQGVIVGFAHAGLETAQQRDMLARS